MLDVEVGAKRVELVRARRRALAQTEEPVGELFSIARREEGLPIGYGRARSPQIAQRVAITGSQVSTVVLLNHTAEGAQHAMTAPHSIAPTLLVAIDISKYRHEVLIGIPGKTRRRRLTVMNTLEDFQRLSAALASYDLPVPIGFEGQTMGLAAIITVHWRTI